MKIALKTKKTKKKIMTLIAVISPLLMMYGTNIMTITLLDMFLIFAIIMAAFDSDWLLNRKQMFFLALCVIVILNFLVTRMTHPANETLSVFLRTLRFVAYLFFVMLLLSDKFFDVDFGLNVYEFVSALACLYLLLQLILLFFADYSLPGYLPFLPLMRDELSSFTDSLIGSSVSRPRSIFAEPSQIGLYVGGYLGISFLYERKEKFIVEKPVMIIALLLSGSTTAVFSVVIIALLCIVRQLRKVNVNVLIGFIIVLLIGLASFFSVTFFKSRLEYFMGRLPIAFSQRMTGFYDYWDKWKEFSFVDILLGIGMNRESMTVWYSGLADIFVYFGLCGTILLAAIVAVLFVKSGKMQRGFLLLFLALSIFSEVLVSNWLILFLPFVLRDLSSYKGIKHSDRRRIIISRRQHKMFDMCGEA